MMEGAVPRILPRRGVGPSPWLEVSEGRAVFGGPEGKPPELITRRGAIPYQRRTLPLKKARPPRSRDLCEV